MPRPHSIGTCWSSTEGVPFDATWEEIFSARTWGRYPAEDLVRFVARRFFGARDRAAVRILDLGCGGGANAWFLAREGFTVTAVDGSAAAVDQTRRWLQENGCAADVSVADFLDLQFPPSSFDAIVDCASIQHNPWPDIVVIHRQVFRMLKPGGWFWGAMLNRDSSQAQNAEPSKAAEIDGYTTGSNDRGVFVHLFSRDEVETLLEPYSQALIDHIDRTDGGGTTRVAQFIAAGQKRAA